MSESICSSCGGSGWKILERDGISAAERCECASEGRQRRLEDRANIPPLYQNASLDTFVRRDDSPIISKQMANVMNVVRHFMREYPLASKPGLLFLGPPGTGKTHLAVAALRGLIAKGFEGIFYDFQNLLDRIRSGYDQASGTMDREAYQTALDTEILLLDDLGAHRITDWVEDTVTSIITYRCNHRKSTIVTTNLRDELAGDERGTGLEADLKTKYYLEERIGSRARSRLFEMCRVVKMPYMEDYRIKRRAM
jgi:DNA replication protein DnaC